MVYHCSGRAGLSAIAAAIHLGRLPADRFPPIQELLDTHVLDRLAAGRLTPMGADGSSVMVYMAGRGKFGPIIDRTLGSVLDILLPESSDKVIPVEIKAKGEFIIGLAVRAMSFRPISGLSRGLLKYALSKGYREVCLNVTDIKAKLGGKE